MTDIQNDIPSVTAQGVPTVGGELPITPPVANPLDGMTPDQIDALALRVEEARRNRPPSLSQQLAALQASITDTAAAKDEKVEQRKTARDDADALEVQLTEIRQTLRRTELMEAVTAAGFKAPTVVAEMLSKFDGDVLELVKTAAASGAYVMNTPAPSAEVGGQFSKQPQGMDPGRLALMAEIRAAQGR